MLKTLARYAVLAAGLTLLLGVAPTAAHAVPVVFDITGDVNNACPTNTQTLNFGVFGFCSPNFSTEEFGKCLSIPIAPGCHTFCVKFAECLPAVPMFVGASHHVFSSCCLCGNCSGQTTNFLQFTPGAPLTSASFGYTFGTVGNLSQGPGLTQGALATPEIDATSACAPMFLMLGGLLAANDRRRRAAR